MVFSYIQSKRPANLFDGSYFFIYLCAMTTLQIIGLIFIATSIWIAFEFWRAPTYIEDGDGKYNLLQPSKKLSDLFKNLIH